MNLDPDDFEKRLQSRPLRQIPKEWREQTLSAVHHASRAQSSLKLAAHRSLQTRSSWRAILLRIFSGIEAANWPGPRAWAALAAAWVVILAVNISTADSGQSLAKRNPLPASEVMLVIQEQERILAELLGPGESLPSGNAQPPPPRPRSQRRIESLTG
jgi:hypothetical protein